MKRQVPCLLRWLKVGKLNALEWLVCILACPFIKKHFKKFADTMKVFTFVTRHTFDTNRNSAYFSGINKPGLVGISPLGWCPHGVAASKPGHYYLTSKLRHHDGNHTNQPAQAFTLRTGAKLPIEATLGNPIKRPPGCPPNKGFEIPDSRVNFPSN